MAWYDRIAALLGISGYSRPGRELARDPAEVERRRRAVGGQIQLPSQPQTRWYLDDIEEAELDASRGILCRASRLVQAVRSDGIVQGALQKRTAFVRLPRIFRGRADSSLSAEIVRSLQVGYERSLFDEMCPSSALESIAGDGIFLGAAIGYLQPVPGRDHPVLVRLSPEFLRYSHFEDQWYYSTTVGELPITPGDGRWVLHLPGGRLAPWEFGCWRAVGQAWVRKDHAANALDAWESTLANPLRIAVAPRATDADGLVQFFEQVLSWGRNTVISMLPGYEVRLVESNGRGADSFRKTIEAAEREIVIALLSQTVTTDGGTGFANAGIHEHGEASLIGKTAASLAHTLSTQVLPPWIVGRWGEEALDEACVMSWDIAPVRDLEARARALSTVATAIEALGRALTSNPAGAAQLDLDALMSEFGIPLRRAPEQARAEERPRPRLVAGGSA
jgi:hypothetical protein